MKYLVLIYNDPQLLESLPEKEFDTTMRGCFNKADQLKKDGKLLDSRMLQAPSTAKSIRVRNGRRTTHDGPFAETKEVLGGYYLIDVETLDEALEWAAKIPSARYGHIEVRPIVMREAEVAS